VCWGGWGGGHRGVLSASDEYVVADDMVCMKGGVCMPPHIMLLTSNMTVCSFAGGSSTSDSVVGAKEPGVCVGEGM
jgi:hypothetical protein